MITLIRNTAFLLIASALLNGDRVFAAEEAEEVKIIGGYVTSMNDELLYSLYGQDFSVFNSIVAFKMAISVESLANFQPTGSYNDGILMMPYPELWTSEIIPPKSPLRKELSESLSVGTIVGARAIKANYGLVCWDGESYTLRYSLNGVQRSSVLDIYALAPKRQSSNSSGTAYLRNYNPKKPYIRSAMDDASEVIVQSNLVGVYNWPRDVLYLNNGEQEYQTSLEDRLLSSLSQGSMVSIHIIQNCICSDEGSLYLGCTISYEGEGSKFCIVKCELDLESKGVHESVITSSVLLFAECNLRVADMEVFDSSIILMPMYGNLPMTIIDIASVH